MKKQPPNRVRVNGQDYSWTIYRQPQWCTADGWRGLAILVELAAEPQRQLIVQFPFVVEGKRSTPHLQRPAVSLSALSANVAAAIDAGWEPESRGKPFVFEVTAAQPGIAADAFGVR
jgi:hypothetical protein